MLARSQQLASIVHQWQTWRNPTVRETLLRVGFRDYSSMLEAVWSTMVWREGTIHSITRSLMMLSGG